MREAAIPRDHGSATRLSAAATARLLGGRGRENVLTAEVLLPLGYLPRQAFLGQVLRAAHGAHDAREAVAREIEAAILTLLPDETVLPPTGIVVQPDATLISANTHVLVEAKRIRAASFQAEQLPREYLALLQTAGARTPLLLVILGAPPPVKLIRHSGRVPLHDAVTLHLEAVHNRVEGALLGLAEMTRRLPETLAWITWAEIQQTVEMEARRFCAA